MAEDNCAFCKKKMSTTTFKYELRDGEIVCLKCAQKQSYGISPSYSDMKLVSFNDFIHNKKIMEKQKNEQLNKKKFFKADKNIEDLILIDEERQQFRLKPLLNLSRVYDLKDVEGYEIIMDDETVTFGGLGRGVKVWGVRFRGAGTIIEAITDKKEGKERIKNLDIKLTLRSFEDPFIYIKLINFPIKVDSLVYNKICNRADSLIDALDICLKNIQYPELKKNLDISQDIIILRELKILLDDGIITNKEFKAKKKKILDI